MSTLGSFSDRHPPEDVNSYNLDTLSGSSTQTGNFSFDFFTEEESLVFATDWTKNIYPSQDDTASQSSWHWPASAISQPAFRPAPLPITPGTESCLNQLQDNQHSVERRLCRSQGYVIEHGEQGDPIPTVINQFHSFQSVQQDGVSQTPSKTLPAERAHLVCKWEGCTYKKPFNRKADLVRHVESMHIAPRSYCCLVEGCSRLFSRKDRRDAHMLQRHLISRSQRQAGI